jgi:putative transposase
MIINDDSTQLTSNAVRARCGEIGVEWHNYALGKLVQNGYVESLNGRMHYDRSNRFN